jgi:hypothetical protein
MSTADRNRSIKKTLELAFGRGRVRVRGDRGTAYGWVSVNIDWTPLDAEQARDMQGKCKQLLRAAKIDLGRTYTDDTCQFESDKCSISFNAARYYRTQRMSNGQLAVLANSWGAEWQTVEG